MPGQAFQTLALIEMKLTKLISWVRYFDPSLLMFLLNVDSLFNQVDSSDQGRQAVSYLILKDYFYVPQVF